MSRFKVGQTVYYGRGEKMKTLVVAKVHKNPLIPVRQYTFEAPNDGWGCGEQSLRKTPDGADLRLRDCFVDDETVVPTRINTIASAKRNPIMMDRVEQFGDVSKLFGDSDVFFRPDLKLVDWLKKYANGRMIIDVGSGQGHLVTMLKRSGARAMGIEPNFNREVWLKFRGFDGDINEILPHKIEDTFIKTLINSLGKDQAILVFARPCHSNFVYNGIYNMPKGMEALYITLPENLDDYDDLGGFKEDAKLLSHEGISEDNEVIYSIVR